MGSRVSLKCKFSQKQEPQDGGGVGRALVCAGAMSSVLNTRNKTKMHLEPQLERSALVFMAEGQGFVHTRQALCLSQVHKFL